MDIHPNLTKKYYFVKLNYKTFKKNKQYLKKIIFNRLKQKFEKKYVTC